MEKLEPLDGSEAPRFNCGRRARLKNAFVIKGGERGGGGEAGRASIMYVISQSETLEEDAYLQRL